MQAIYEERLAARTKALAGAERTQDRIGNLRLGLALVALILLILPLFTRQGGPWWGLFGVAIAFIWLGKWHDRASERARRLRASVRFYQGGLDRLLERWRTLPDDGKDLPDELKKRALYSDDLDLFGPASLFQLVVRA